MIMTLEEAIRHAEATAIENEKEAKRKREHGGWYYDSEARACAICAEENRQFAEWLRELQERRKQPETIKRKECKYMTEHYDTDGNAPYWTCSEWDSGTDYDGFCHYAERRTNE